MYDKALGNAMLGNVDEHTATELVTLHSKVCNQIFCEYCQGIMDSRKSVIISGGSGLVQYRALVLCGNCFDKGKASSLASLDGASVTDSREFKTDGTLKKSKKSRKPKKQVFMNIATDGGFRKVEIHSRILVNVPKTRLAPFRLIKTIAYEFFIHGKRGDWTATCSLTGRRAMRRATLKEIRAELAEHIIGNLDAYIDAVTFAEENNGIAPVVE